MYQFRTLICIAALALLAFVGCEDASTPFGNTNLTADNSFTFLHMPFQPDRTPPPTELVTVTFGTEAFEFWPYTGENFTGQGHDPVNVIFYGKADPRSIRAALMSLDGDRTGFDWPDEAPFNGTWQDAIGNIQTGYSVGSDWTGGAIQLACGDYHSARFHLRLFRCGEWTVANAHFEVLIPGTSDHQVLSWEFAEQFVITDLIRSGVLDADLPMVFTQAINPAPFGAIPAVIYNGLPVSLRAAIGGPLSDVTVDVPIGTDGRATIFNVVTSLPWEPGINVENSVSTYDQVIPKPFCSDGPYDFVHVAGPVYLNQINELTPTGEFISTFRAEGELLVTPVNPITGEVVGETKRALVREHHDAFLSEKSVRASSLQNQTILPPSAEDGGKLLIRLRVNSDGANGYKELIQCGDNEVSQVAGLAGSTLVDPYVK